MQLCSYKCQELRLYAAISTRSLYAALIGTSVTEARSARATCVALPAEVAGRVSGGNAPYVPTEVIAFAPAERLHEPRVASTAARTVSDTSAG